MSEGEAGAWSQVVRGLVSVTDTIPVTTLSHGHSQVLSSLISLSIPALHKQCQVTKLLSWDLNNDWM